METKTKREILLETFFNQDISLSEAKTASVINEYIRETKKLDYVVDCPVQLVIENGRCVYIEVGTGYNHQYRVVVWYNRYMTQRNIKDCVNAIFKRDTTEHKNITKKGFKMRECINVYQENIKKMIKHYFGDELDAKTIIHALLDGEVAKELGYCQEESETMYNYLNENKGV